MVDVIRHVVALFCHLAGTIMVVIALFSTSLEHILKIAAGIGTPIALVAFLAGLAYLAYAQRLKKEQEDIRSIPQHDRARLLDSWLTKYGLTAVGLTSDQAYQLILRELDYRASDGREKFRTLVRAAVFLICVAIGAWVYAQSIGKTDDSVTPPPIQFTSEWHESYANPGLPNLYFGDIQDAEKQPRAWMKTLQDGALTELGLPQANTKLMWGFTSPPFLKSCGPFQVYINVGTDAEAVVYAYRFYLENGQYAARALTKRGKQGSKPEYPFEVQASSKDDVLVAFVAMSKDSYSAMSRDPKFLIRSRPLNP